MNIASLSLPSTVARDMATSAGRKIPRAGFTQLLEFQLFFKNTLWRVSFLPAERLQRGAPPAMRTASLDIRGNSAFLTLRPSRRTR
jgi:hypothetical protein